MSGQIARTAQRAVRIAGSRPSGLAVATATATAATRQMSTRPSAWSGTMTATHKPHAASKISVPTTTMTTTTTTARGYATTAEAPELPVSLATVLQELSAAGAPSHPAVYATVHIHGRAYLVTPGDRVRLPFRMPEVQPGDVLRLDRVGVVGSRNVTALGSGGGQGGSGAGPVGEGARQGGHVPGVTVTAVVLGVETEPLRILVKKKRRTRRKRTVRSKHQYTVLRIQDVEFA